MFTVTSVSRSASSRPRRTVAYSSTAFTAPPRSPVWAFSPDRAARTLPELCPARNGAYVVSGYRPAPRQRVYGSDRNRNLVDIHIVRQHHAKAVGCVQVFGCMNVRSLLQSKLDSLLVELNDQPMDVLLLCETWHDADSVVIRRLHADGYSVMYVEPSSHSDSTTAASPLSMLPVFA